MMLPGTFNGYKVKDLKVYIAKEVQEYYKERGTWDDIVAFRSYEYTDVITLKIKGGLRKDKWKQKPWQAHQRRSWYIADDEFVWDYKKRTY